MNILIFILGAIFGSFINCLVGRLRANESLWTRSHCDNCHRQIGILDNIPIISWLFLGGKCRHCQQKFSVRYLLSEFMIAGLFVLVWQKIGVIDLELVRNLLAVCVLAFIFLYDLAFMSISLEGLLVLSLPILVLNILLGFNPLIIALAIIIGALFFGLQYALTKGRGIGEGDIWIGAVLGIIFPDLKLLAACLFWAYILGLIYAVITLILGKKEMRSQVPLGVFLASGAIITIFYGNWIVNWYLGVLK